MSGWWNGASIEQRLAQVDAGIELGLTGRQIALASGTSAMTVHSVANNHGRFFGPKGARPRQAVKSSASAAYFRGERVDFWRDSAQDRNGHARADFEEIVLE